MLQVFDRITISAIDDWRVNNPDVNLKTYFVKTDQQKESDAFKAKLGSFIKEVTDNSEKIVKHLAKKFAAEKDEEKIKFCIKTF